MTIDKEKIYQEVKSLFDEWYGDRCDGDLANQGACLYWTQCGMRVLCRDYGLRAVLQAGTMLWPIVKPETDSGECATHFGYKWTPNDPFSQAQLAVGDLPEVHIWIALPDRNEIIDFSTGNLKHVATVKHGMKWETPDPPRYVWGTPVELDRDYKKVLYRPNRPAIDFVWRFIMVKHAVEACAA